MSQTLTYVIGQDRRAHVDDVQNFKINFDGGNSNWVQARQYERSMRQVFVNIKNEDGTPFDLTGCNVWFEGLLPKNSNGDFRIIDDKGYVALDPSAGRFRFDMPGHAFTVAGSYRQAFFRIAKDGKSVATLEFDLEVLADKVIGGLVPRDYISPLEDLLDQALQDFKAKSASFDQILSDLKKQFADTIADLNKQGMQVTTLLTDLQSRIEALTEKEKQAGLFTQAEAEAFKKSLELAINQKIIQTYDTIDDMQADANLVKGMTVETIGAIRSDDKGGAKYKVTDSPIGYNIALANGLFAQKIFDSDDGYYSEVTSEIKYRDDIHTTVYFIHIPKTDNQGNLIHPYLDKTGDKQAPSNYARKNHTTFTMNASLSTLTESGTWEDGHVIGNGKIINRKTYTKAVPDNFKYIGIKADRTIAEYPNSTSPEEMLADGVTDAMMVYWPLVKNGQIVDMTDFEANEGHWHVENYDPRIALGVTSSGEIIIGATDGRTMTDKGVTSQQMAQMMIDKGCVNAWHLDGGGSISLSLRESKLNRSIDQNGLFERQIKYTFNVRKDNAGGGLAELHSEIAKAKSDTVRQVVALRNNFYGWNTKPRGTFKVTTDDDLEKFKAFIENEMINLTNAMHGAGMVGYILNVGTNTVINRIFNAPYAQTYYYHFTWDSNYGQLMIQNTSAQSKKAFMLYNGTIDNHWSDWKLLDETKSVPVTKVYDQPINRFDVVQNGQTVVIDADLTIPTLAKWVNAVSGLPVPKQDTVTELRICDDAESLARVSVQKSGTFGVYGSKGNFPVNLKLHLSYVTEQQQHLIQGGQDWW